MSQRAVDCTVKSESVRRPMAKSFSMEEGFFYKNILQVAGRDVDDCGYCGKKLGMVMFGLNVLEIDEGDYSSILIQKRNFLKSGGWLYHHLKESCCMLYQIRVPVQRFLPSKNQRKILKNQQNMNLQISMTGNSSITFLRLFGEVSLCSYLFLVLL